MNGRKGMNGKKRERKARKKEERKEGRKKERKEGRKETTKLRLFEEQK